MRTTLSVALVLGVSLAACSGPESAPAPAPVSKTTTPPSAPSAPAPAKPAPATPAPAAADPMKAADALFTAGKYAEAAAAFEAITKAQPANADAWFKLGYSLHVIGELDRAITAHIKAAEFPSFRPVALYNLGCAQALKGNPDAAFEALGKAIDSGFDQLKQLEGDADLASLRSDARYAALVARLMPNKA
jgi:Flp pilus assembly protein TadD